MKNLLFTLLLITSFNAFSQNSNSTIIVNGADQYDFTESNKKCGVSKLPGNNQDYVSMHFSTNEYAFALGLHGVSVRNGENDISRFALDNLSLTVFNGGPRYWLNRGANPTCKIKLLVDESKKEIAVRFNCNGVNDSQSHSDDSKIEGTISCFYK